MIMMAPKTRTTTARITQTTNIDLASIVESVKLKGK